MKIKFGLKEEGKSLEIKETDIETARSLKWLQGIVGGYIEAITVNGFDIYLNEEGKINGKCKENFGIVEIDEEKVSLVDCIFGNAVFLKHDQHGDVIGLTEEECEKLENEFDNDIKINVGGEKIDTMFFHKVGE